MKARTLKALRGSIRKWERIVGEGEGGWDDGQNNCPLCTVFIPNECDGCPVAEKSGKRGCGGTPYERWTGYQIRSRRIHPLTIFDAKSRRLARSELKFLRNLLPAEDRA